MWKVSKYGVFSGQYFPAFGLNTKRYFVSLCIQSECGYLSVFSPNAGKYGPGKTPYLDTFHAVNVTCSCLEIKIDRKRNISQKLKVVLERNYFSVIKDENNFFLCCTDFIVFFHCIFCFYKVIFAILTLPYCMVTNFFLSLNVAPVRQMNVICKITNYQFTFFTYRLINNVSWLKIFFFLYFLIFFLWAHRH